MGNQRNFRRLAFPILSLTNLGSKGMGVCIHLSERVALLETYCISVVPIHTIVKNICIYSFCYLYNEIPQTLQTKINQKLKQTNYFISKVKYFLNHSYICLFNTYIQAHITF